MDPGDSVLPCPWFWLMLIPETRSASEGPPPGVLVGDGVSAMVTWTMGVIPSDISTGYDRV
jgi:hypothetical protein